MRGYLDHNATTPVREEVRSVIVELLGKPLGNPNSPHHYGTEARYVIEKARRRMARLLNASSPENLIYTSGGSESNNLALRGVCRAARRQGRGNHLIVSAAEHKAVLDTALHLRDQDKFDLSILPVDSDARVDPAELQKLLKPDTVLVSIMAANNEVGTINPIREVVSVVREGSQALIHTDAIQCLGRIPVDLQEWGVDLATFTAHKIYGPKGIGLLYKGEKVWIDPEITGGGQERGLRAGTENPIAIAAFAEAVDLAVGERLEGASRQQALIDELWQCLDGSEMGIIRNSPVKDCLPNTLHISVSHTDSQRVLAQLDKQGFALSSGSACSSTSTTLSHVLLAMGCDEDRARSSIRISIGRDTTKEMIRDFAATLEGLVKSVNLKKAVPSSSGN